MLELIRVVENHRNVQKNVNFDFIGDSPLNTFHELQFLKATTGLDCTLLDHT